MKKLFFLSCLTFLLSFCMIPVNPLAAQETDQPVLAGQKTDQSASRAVTGVFIPGHEPNYFKYECWEKNQGFMAVNKDGVFAKIDFADPSEKAIADFNETSKKIGFPYLVEYHCWSGTLFLRQR